MSNSPNTAVVDAAVLGLSIKSHPMIQFIAQQLSDRFFSDPELRAEVASSSEPFNALVRSCIPESEHIHADALTHAVRDALYDTPFVVGPWPQDAVEMCSKGQCEPLN